MDSAFPDHAWIRVDRATFQRLRRYRAQERLCSWEDAFEQLLPERSEERI